MKNYIIFNDTKRISRTGSCPISMINLQAGDGEFVIEGIADSLTQKVDFDGLDEKGQPVNPRVVDKSSAEIERDDPVLIPISDEKRSANITNEQYQALLRRVEKLEKKEN